MSDASERRPSLAARFVGGVQWSLTAAYVFLLGFLLAAWYLRATRTPISLDVSRAFLVVVAAAFAAGYLWVATRSRPGPAAARAHARRVEVVLSLLVLGFVLPFGASVVRQRAGPAVALPLFEFAVAYAASILLSYGLVYGLGARPFLGSEQ